MKKEIIGDCVMYLGECEKIFRKIERFSEVDAIITDPPYGIGANRQTLGNGKKTFHRGNLDWDATRPNIRWMLDSGKKLCVWGGNYFTDVLPPTNDWLIWHKNIANVSFSECEMAWTNFGRQVRHLTHHWSGEDKRHPTMKPLRVMVWCLTYLKPDEKLILDPFAGSGTTGVAAVNSGKKFIGVERDEKYFDIACERIAEAHKQQDMFLTKTEYKQEGMF
jgi:DNA modification methylase